jgi:trehalose 6-phosphate phosphatase
MKNILSLTNRQVLQQFAWSNVLLAFDFDGTLAPIVSKPERAVMRPTTRQLLEQVAKLYPCIVISGRAQLDARRMLRGVGVREIIGNHGLEPFGATVRLMYEVQRWRCLLEKRLAALRGVTVEDKTYSIAVHYRHSRAKKKARAAILRAASSLGRTRLIGGKQVVNIIPDGAPHKGIALEHERTRLLCDTAIYVGDDETDEDVFTLDQPGQLLAIRVGLESTSAASFYIRSQREIDTFMQVLVQLRQKAGIEESRTRGL